MAFRKGDFVRLRLPTGETVVGKINEIENDTFYYNRYYYCSELKHKLRDSEVECRSNNELIQTAETTKEFVANILARVEVFTNVEGLLKYFENHYEQLRK